MKKKLKNFFDWVLLLLTGGGPIAEEAAQQGLCDFSGQGSQYKK